MAWLDNFDKDLDKLQERYEDWEQLEDETLITTLQGIIKVKVYKFDSALKKLGCSIAGACYAIDNEKRIPVVAVTNEYMELCDMDRRIAKFIILHELAHHIFGHVDPINKPHRNIYDESMADIFAASILPIDYSCQMIFYIETRIRCVKSQSIEPDKKKRVLDEYIARKVHLADYISVLEQIKR